MTESVDTEALFRSIRTLVTQHLIAADETDRLRAMIENAPHDSSCQFSFLPEGKPRLCTCWKASAL